MAFSWDSCEVGALSPAPAFEPFPLFPFPPPLLPDPPPFPPEPWDDPGDPPPPEGAFPWPSPLEERLSDCLPRVRGGGCFDGAALEPPPLPPPPPDGLAVPAPFLVPPASPDSPAGFWALALVLEPEDASLVLDITEEGVVLATKAAHPVRPLPAEDAPVPPGLAAGAEVCGGKREGRFPIKSRTSSHQKPRIVSSEG